MSSVLEFGTLDTAFVAPNDTSGLFVIAEFNNDNNIVINEIPSPFPENDPGNDIVLGGRAKDFISTSDGEDSLRGGRGNDTLLGERGNDTLIGGKGDDLIRGGRNDDFLRGGNGDDSLRGGRGNDTVIGGRGNDLLRGGNGNDILEGGRGNDTVIGGRGNDLLRGGNGSNTLRGGQGNDIFEFDISDLRDDKIDKIVDFEVGLDQIRLTGVGRRAARRINVDENSIKFRGETLISIEGDVVNDANDLDLEIF